MARLNKKIICFVDEYGTAGDDSFALGCAMVWAHECGKADKAFSDILPASVNEVHAANWDKATLQGLLGKYAQTQMPPSLLLMNKASGAGLGSKPEIYAKALVEVTKAIAKRFRDAQSLGQIINNIEIILDANEQNCHARFEELIGQARQSDGLFKAVTRVVAIDSTVSRMLQVADVVAHSRSWIVNGDENAKGLRDSYKIECL